MKRIIPTKAIKASKAFLVKHSADILTGFATFGVVWTAIESGKAHLRAHEYLEQNGYSQANPDTQKVLKLEAAKNYIKPVLIGSMTVGSIIGSNYINHKKIAGLAAACTVAETALSEHRDKIEELMGAKALNKIDDELNLDKGAESIASDEEIFETGKGRVLICEGYLTGRKCWASTEWLYKCVNDYNELVNHDTYAAYAEFLDLFWRTAVTGIDVPDIANEIGYGVHRNGIMRIHVTTDLDPRTGEPFVIFTPSNKPISTFMEML